MSFQRLRGARVVVGAAGLAGVTNLTDANINAAATTINAAIARVDPGVAPAAYQAVHTNDAATPVFATLTFLDISWFGATKDNSAFDNIAAINAAITKAVALGIRTVYIPDGTWWVKPATTTGWIKVPSNIRLLGSIGATIKVWNDTGNFQTVVGAPTEGGAVSNVVIENVTIDLNPTGNTTGTIANLAGQVQNAIRFTNFDGVTVRNVRCTPCCGQNTILLTGNGCKNARVIDCLLVFVRRGAGTTYDNSAIYVECIGQEIRGNRGEAAISEKAFGFIETHNGQAVIAANRSKGFRTGCNIVAGSFADALLTSSDITVEGNNFSDAQRAIVLWPTANGLRNIAILGNPLSLAQVQHNQTTCCGVGIETSTPNTGPIEGLTIEGNPITFEADTRTTAEGGLGLSGLYMGGILVGGRGSITGLAIHNNPVTRSPGSGVRVGDTSYVSNPVTNADISGNPLTDCGYNQTLHSAFRIPLYLDGTLTNVKAHDNPIHDTGSPAPRAGNSIRANFTLDAISEVYAYNNPVTQVGTPALAATIDRTLIGDYTGSASLNFPSIAAGGSAVLTMTVLGAKTTDIAHASPASSLEAGLIVKQVWVSAANTVSIEVANFSAGAVDPAAKTWVAGIQKRTT